MRKDFGSCAKGSVESVEITDGQGIYAEIISYGAALRKLEVPDRSGRPLDVVLGYDTAEEYEKNDGHLGATVGRVCNRIGGASFTLSGVVYPLAANLPGGHILHGGPEGFSRRLFTLQLLTENEAVFTLKSPDGDQGFPGELRLEVCYSLKQPGELQISYRSSCSKPCPANFTNHAYFNLDGHDSGPIDAQTLRINADSYTPTDPVSLIPTGEIRSLDGLAADARREKPMKQFFAAGELAATAGLDNNYCLQDSARLGRGTAPAAVFCGKKSGIRLEVYTDLPGIQAYSSGNLSERAGKNGAVYGPHQALCLETQKFPDAVHHGNFESCVVPAGEVFTSKTIYRFGIKEKKHE